MLKYFHKYYTIYTYTLTYTLTQFVGVHETEIAAVDRMKCDVVCVTMQASMQSPVLLYTKDYCIQLSSLFWLQAIVGGGLGGLALAVGLQERGFNVLLFGTVICVHSSVLTRNVLL